MIRYDLRCLPGGHDFDGWFRSSDDFDAQAERRLLACPLCGNKTVGKALMAPAVSTRRAPTPAEPQVAPAAGETALADPREQKLREMMRELRREATRNSEDVGDRFPEVARRMHAEEIEPRTVHGRATPEEAKALAEEGVPLQALPVCPDEMN